MSTSTLPAPSSSSSNPLAIIDPQFPTAGAFAAQVLEKLNAVPSVSITTKDLTQLHKARNLLATQTRTVHELIDVITNLSTIQNENRCWEAEYDHDNTRKELVSAMTLMHKYRKRVIELNNIINDKIDMFVQACRSNVEETTSMLDGFTHHAVRRYDDQMLELAVVRQRKQVKNLGLWAPFELANAMSTWKGQVIAPRGFARQFNEEFLQRLPQSEHDPKTAMPKVLIGTDTDVAIKWIPPVVAIIKKGGMDQLSYVWIPIAERMRQTYAPETKPFSALETRFYKEQLENTVWYNREWIERVLQERQRKEVEDRLTEEQKRKIQEECIRAQILTDEIRIKEAKLTEQEKDELVNTVTVTTGAAEEEKKEEEQQEEKEEKSAE